MSPTSDDPTRRGFTLVEVLVATSIAAIVLAGLLAAYLFIGRNLTRLAYYHQQDSESRRTLQTFTQDVSAAVEVTTAQATSIVLTKVVSTGNVQITYQVLTQNNVPNFLRQEGSNTAVVMLKNVSTLQITYYDASGNTPAGLLPRDVKSVELKFTTTAGDAINFTQVAYPTVSPRIYLRNRQLLTGS